MNVLWLFKNDGFAQDSIVIEQISICVCVLVRASVF